VQNRPPQPPQRVRSAATASSEELGGTDPAPLKPVSRMAVAFAVTVPGSPNQATAHQHGAHDSCITRRHVCANKNAEHW